ncbi:uncharacterized protein BJ212DRAFT_531830 [Suillus subaureus]|uniref:Uncharacterized protein n=1 Tax=Suillus subaureus TaxID=48587 RepID=A0A9P7EL40_9AGAM|nr:uncharacterized protein BJ212DRAFT_531830 [Suillus subaureus]KAG1824507.1 hypothetical protein BJ212DRAFT_531830 [Suillus subaureus]
MVVHATSTNGQYSVCGLCFACCPTHAGFCDERRKSRNYVSDMMWVFINMGLFSCILAITVAVVVSGCRPCLRDEGSRLFQYMFQDGLMGQFYTAAPGAVIAKCQYVSFALRIH